MGEECLEIYNSFSWQNDLAHKRIGEELDEIENYFDPPTKERGTRKVSFCWL